MDDAIKKPPLIMLVLITAIGPLAVNIFVPSMPGLQVEFGITYVVAQLTLSLYLLALAFSQPIYGPMADRFGRRPVALFGLTVMLVASLVCVFASNIEVLLFGRALQAFGAGAGQVVARAMLRDSHDTDKSASAMGYLIMMMVVAPMLAPTIGGYVDAWFGWRTIFVCVAVFAGLILLAAVPYLKETRPGNATSLGFVRQIFGSFTLLQNPVFSLNALQVSFSTGAFFAFLGGAPFIFVTIYGLAPEQFGIFFLLISAFFMVGNFITGKLAMRLGPLQLVRVGTVLALLGVALLVGLELAGLMTPIIFFGSMCFIALGNGMNMPNGSMLAISADPQRAGAASGLLGFIQMMLAAALSTLVSTFLDDSALPLIIIMALCALIAFFIVWLPGGARAGSGPQ